MNEIKKSEAWRMGYSKSAWRMTIVAIAAWLWFPVVFAISVFFYWNIPLERWFPNALARFPIQSVVFISVIIAGYLIIFFTTYLVIRFIMGRFAKRKD